MEKEEPDEKVTVALIALAGISPAENFLVLFKRLISPFISMQVSLRHLVMSFQRVE